jgi:hypothetical protein
VHKYFGKMENLTSGKGWAYGYESWELKRRRQEAKRFDVRNLFGKKKGGK